MVLYSIRIKKLISQILLSFEFFLFFSHLSIAQDVILSELEIDEEGALKPYIEQIRKHYKKNMLTTNESKTNTRIDLGIMSSTINVPGDFQTIQRAIDAAIDGDTILVASGIYKETLEITEKNLTIIGEDKDSTIIDGIDSNKIPSFPKFLFRQIPVVFIDGGICEISGFTIINGKFGGVGVVDSEEVVISDSIINENRVFGIVNVKFTISNSTIRLINNQVTNTDSLTSGRFGRGINIEDSNFELTGNTVEGNKQLGIFISNSTGSVSENTIKENNISGVFVRNGTSIDINNNIVNGHEQFELNIVSSTGSVIQNTISGNTSIGLNIRKSNVDITGNIINGNKQTGINIESSTGGFVFQNTISGNTVRGLNIQRSSNIDIEENTIDGNGKNGDVDSGGIDVLLSDNINLFNNTISDNFNGLIVQQSTFVKIFENTINGNSRTSLFLGLSNNSEITDNKITDTVDFGDFGACQIQESSDLTIKGNDISFNNVGGLAVLSGSVEIEISENTIVNNETFGISIRCDSSGISGCGNVVNDNDPNFKDCAESQLENVCSAGDF